MKSFANSKMPLPRPIASRRATLGLLSLAALLLLGALFFFFDPVRHSFYPTCLFHKLTGLNCPGCGGLRALHHLTHGSLVTAFRCNPLFIGLLPFLLFLALRWFLRGREAIDRDPILFRPRVLWSLLVVTLLFTILRNLPWSAFAWMSP